MSHSQFSLCLALIGLLALSLATTATPPTISSPGRSPGPASEEKRLAKKLETPVTVSYLGCPLFQVLRDVRDVYHIKIAIDNRALREEGLSLEGPVTVKLERVSLKSELNLVLQQAKLAYVIKDEVLWITSEQRSHGKPIKVTFPVADLVLDGDNSPLVVTCGPGGVRVEFPASARPPLNHELIKLITSTIAPGSWSELGGQGTIEYLPPSRSLLIYQADDLQEQVQDLLEALRRLQDVRVSLEVRLLCVPSTCYEAQELKGPAGPKVMDAKSFQALVSAAHLLQQPIRLQTTRLTAIQGQNVVLRTGNNGGREVRLTPVVSADQDSVCLSTEFQSRGKADEPALSTTSRVPDGGTVVLRGWAATEAAFQACPTLTNILDVNRLVRSFWANRQGKRVLVCVTSRVVRPGNRKNRQE